MNFGLSQVRNLSKSHSLLRRPMFYNSIDRSEISNMADLKTDGKTFLIDTDAGIDDAHAIMMALRQPQHKVIGITCVQGNTTVDQVCKNVFRLLKVCKRIDIPVYQGVCTSLVGTNAGPSFYHGKDGFGDTPDPEPQDFSALLQKEHAVNAIVRLVNENPGKLTLIGLGPLTNIAMAIRLDPQLGKKLRDCYIMGGNYQGKGNITTSAEFNFHSDPEAAYIVLNELACPITLATWELCLQHSLSWEWYDRFINQPTEKAKFMKWIEKNNIENFYNGGGTTKQYGTADEIAMATALDQTVAIETKHVFATLELNGSNTRGQMIVDWDNHLKKSQNDTYHVIRKPDTQKSKFMQQIEKKTVKKCLDEKWPTYIPCDEIAMSLACDIDVTEESQQVYATIELSGTHTRGQMVVDWEQSLRKPTNVTIITKLKHVKYFDILKMAVR